MKADSAQKAGAFFANLTHALRTGETISVGGGIFSPAEIRLALDYVHDMREALIDSQKCIAKACAEDVYKDCIVPAFGESTFNRARQLTSVYHFPSRI